MILRRLTQSLKEQHWMAIAIEFVLLVLGVFLGIQVSNWNTDLETRQKGAVFTQRLKDDLRRDTGRRQRDIAYDQEVHAAAEAAVYALNGKRPLGNEALLVNAYRATQYWQSSRQCATYGELRATGSIGLITNRRLAALALIACGDLAVDDLRRARDESPYRALFRTQIDNDVQRALAQQCGDRIAPRQTAYYLEYPCQLGLDAAAVDAAAEALRGNPQALPLLRGRLADLETQLSDNRRMNQALVDGLAAIEKEGP